MSIEDVYLQQRHHLSAFFQGMQFEELSWLQGPMHETLPRWRVLRGRLNSPKGPWIYVTHGAWEAAAAHHVFEFFLLAPQPLDDPHVELLAMLTFFYADPRSALEVGRVVNIGRPIVHRSKLDHILISLPYPFGPDFEHCIVGETHIRYLWALPITSSEADFVNRHGVEAFEAKLEESRIDAGDYRRRSVVR